MTDSDVIDENYFSDVDDISSWLHSSTWSDIHPTLSSTSSTINSTVSAVSIAYSEEFREINNFFHVILLSKELSYRVFKLTEFVIKHNPANYTAWFVRRNCLQKFINDVESGDDKKVERMLEKEMGYLFGEAVESQKNYQIWFHRRGIVELYYNYFKDKKTEEGDDGEDLKTFLSRKELNFSAHFIRIDSKNYHAWSHRQWAINFFGLIKLSQEESAGFQDELQFIEELLLDDVRNNSAWNQRYFIVSKKFDLKSNLDVIKNELKFVFDKIQIAVFNESPYNYISGLVIMNDHNFSSFPEIKTFAENLLSDDAQERQTFEFGKVDEDAERKRRAKKSAPLLGLLLLIYEEEKSSKALEICRTLQVVDAIRAKYWEMRAIEAQKAIIV